MEVEIFQPLFYALDGYITPFAVILWILLPEPVKCNHLSNTGLTPKMIDNKLSSVIYKSREKLTRAIFYKGKLYNNRFVMFIETGGVL